MSKTDLEAIRELVERTVRTQGLYYLVGLEVHAQEILTLLDELAECRRAASASAHDKEVRGLGDPRYEGNRRAVRQFPTD